MPGAKTTESENVIQDALKRVTSSHTFQQVDRLRRFLTFVVQEALAGRADQLKEFVIGSAVFDKDPSFDPRTDPIVRVQARRLRTRLARYYQEEGTEDRLVIDLPRGAYAPTFRTRETAPPKKSLSVVLASRNTISVLPFADHSPGRDLGYFCEGMSQEIAQHLCACENLRVLAWDADPGGTALRETAAKLDIAMLVRGSVRQSGQKLRITVEMIDGASGSYLWSTSFDRGMKDVFEVQTETAKAVVAQVTSEKGPGTKSSAAGRVRENLAARNLYLQARYHIEQRTEEGLQKAVDLFGRAVAENSQYSQAFSGLADAWGLLGHYGVLPPVEVWNKAASNAATAVMLDSNSAEAHASLAHVKSTQDWDWTGADVEFRRAIQLDPRYPAARHWYAISCLAPVGRLDEALQQIEVGHALDPISAIIAKDFAMIRYFRGDSEGALDQIDHTISLNPYFSPAYWSLGMIQEQRGDVEEALASFRRAVQLSPSTPRMQSGLARCFALSGRLAEAERIRQDLLTLGQTRYVSPFELASVHFAMGQTDLGFEWLAKSFQNRCFEVLLLRVDPRFDPLRGDPRFESLYRQLGLPDCTTAEPND